MNPVFKNAVAALLLFTACLSCSQEIFAQGYSRATPKGKFIGTYMEDFRYPQLPTGTYIPFLYTTYENGAPFYSGIKGNGPEFAPVFIASFWQGKMKEPIKPLYSGLTINLSHSGGEGASGGASGKFPFVKNNQWYKIVYKIWQPEDNPHKHSYYGIWIKNIETNQWHTLAVFELPVLSKGFKSVGGFIESLSATAINELKVLHRRFSYAQIVGEEGWMSLDSIGVRALEPRIRGEQGTYYHISQEGDVQIIKQARKSSLLKEQNVPANGQKTWVDFKQPETPSLGSFEIASVKCEQASSGQLLVSYTLADGSVPAVGGRIEVLGADPAKPESVGYFNLPYQTSVLVDSTVKNPRVRVSLRSILDQTDQSEIVSAVAHKPAQAKVFSGEVAPGLAYKLMVLEKKQVVDDLDAALSLPVIAQGTTGNLNIYPASKFIKSRYALQFHGYLKPPKTGLYQFHLRCTGSYRFAINGESITVDGVKEGSRPRVVTVMLNADQLATLEMDYFDDLSGKAGNLALVWSGPGIELQKIPADFLFQSEVLGSFTLAHKKGADSRLELTIDSEDTADIAKVVYLCDERTIGTVEATSKTNGFPLQTIALHGVHQYSATLFFKNDMSSRTLPLRIEHSSKIPDWNINPKGITTGMAGFQASENGGISFTGISRQALEREVAGDYTLKVHVASITGGRPGKSIVSLRPRGKRFSINRTFPSTSRHPALFLPAHSRNFGSDSYGFSTLDRTSEPGEPEWLAIARRGRHSYTYYSYDGTKWYKTSEVTDARIPTRETVSIMFESKHDPGYPLFNVEIDQINFENRFDPSLKPRSWIPEGPVVNKDTITGFLYLSEQKVLARTGNGLLASTDFGKTFAPFPSGNASRKKVTGFVRSIVANPADKNELYCAVVQKGKSKLLYSGDAGETWVERKCPASFDDDLIRSAAYGEIIAVHPSQSNIVVLGGKENDIYVSRDRGESWSVYYQGTGATSFVRFSNLGETANDFLWAAQGKSDDNNTENGYLLQWTCTKDSGGFPAGSKAKPKKFASPANAYDIRISRFKGNDFSITTDRGVFLTFSGGRTFERHHSFADFHDRRDADFIYDEPVTALDNYPRNSVEIIAVSARMRNAQLPERIQMTTMKGYFPKRLPKGKAFSDDEQVIDMVFSEDDREKLIISTTHGVYFTTKASISRGSPLEQGTINHYRQ